MEPIAFAGERKHDNLPKKKSKFGKKNSQEGLQLSRKHVMKATNMWTCNHEGEMPSMQGKSKLHKKPVRLLKKPSKL